MKESHKCFASIVVSKSLRTLDNWLAFLLPFLCCNLVLSPFPPKSYLSPVCPSFRFATTTNFDDDHIVDVVCQLRDEAPDEPPSGPVEVVREQLGELEQTNYVDEPPSGEQLTQMENSDLLNGGSEHSQSQTGV